MRLNTLKNFVHHIKQKIPLNIKIVAEIRLMWADIVGEKFSGYSQPFKCEYVSKKDEKGSNTGEFHRRLLVYVKNDITKTAMTAYTALYLEKIPKKHRIHSLRFQYTGVPLISIETLSRPQAPIYWISEEEKQNLVHKVRELTLSPDLEKTMIDYLIVCWHQKNRDNKV
ncbi:MAG: hypothetical protein ACRCWI_05725 [Brevinema sp.]